MNILKLTTSFLVIALFVLVVPAQTLAASNTSKVPSCSIKAPTKAVDNGKKVKISWKSKNAKSATWTQDAPNVQLGLSGKAKKSGKKMVDVPASTIGNAYKVTLAVTGKDGKMAFCSTSLITTDTATVSAEKATIDDATLRPVTGAAATITGTAPKTATLEIYVADSDFTGLTDYKNIRANMMFQIKKQVFMGTLMTFTADGKWSARFSNGIASKSRVYVFDVKTGSLLVTKTVSK